MFWRLILKSLIVVHQYIYRPIFMLTHIGGFNVRLGEASCEIFPNPPQTPRIGSRNALAITMEYEPSQTLYSTCRLNPPIYAHTTLYNMMSTTNWFNQKDSICISIK